MSNNAITACIENAEILSGPGFTSGAPVIATAPHLVGRKHKQAPPPAEQDSADDDYERQMEELNEELASYPLTDLGNAERFARRYRDQLLYC